MRLRQTSEFGFSGFVPGPDDMLDHVVGFIKDLLILPPGEVQFYGRQFGYESFIYRVYPRPWRWYHLFLDPGRLSDRPYDEFWHSEDAAAFLQAEFDLKWAWLIREEERVEAVAPQLAIAPTPILAPPVKLSSRRRGLLQMAQEMEMDAGALEDQIDSGAYNYVVSLLVECQSMVKSGEGYGTYAVRREYLFDKADAEYNVIHRNEPGVVTIKKKEMGK